MTEDLEIRHRLLAGPDIVGQLGDDYFAELKLQIDADTDRYPRIVLTGDAADGTTIRVVEGVTFMTQARTVGGYRMNAEDQPLVRGIIWYAMVGEIRLKPTYRAGTEVVPCRIQGGRLAMSTQSAQDALDRGRQAFTGTALS